MIHFVCLSWTVIGETTYYLNKLVQCCIVNCLQLPLSFLSPELPNLIFTYMKHWQWLFVSISGWYMKKQKPLTSVFLKICWKCHVWSFIWVALLTVCPRIPSQTWLVSLLICAGIRGRNRTWWGLYRSGLFHQSLFNKQKVAEACYFVDRVFFYAEPMCKGSGNVMFGFSLFSMLGCCVSFLSKTLVCMESCVVQAPLFVWLF